MCHIFQLIENFYYEIWNKKKINKALLGSLFAEDLLWLNPVSCREGLEGLQEILECWHQGFPDCCVNKLKLRLKGQVAHATWEAMGTHEGDFLGIEPTGKKVCYVGQTSFVPHQSKIIHIATSIPMLQIFQQLGIYLRKEDYPEQSCFFNNEHLIVERIRCHYPELTNREVECLSLLLLGFTGKQIANLLCISVRTVESHFSAGFMKLGFLKKDSFIERLFKDKTYMMWHDLGHLVLNKQRPWETFLSQ